VDPEGRTSVPRCGLDDDALAWDELAIALCGLDHGFGDTVLHRASRREKFDLSDCREGRTVRVGSQRKELAKLTQIAFEAIVLSNLVQADEGSVADGLKGSIDNMRRGH